MFKSFADARAACAVKGRKILAVAAAQDEEVLRTVAHAGSEGLAEAILVGDEGKILSLLDKGGTKENFRVVHQPDDGMAALAAARLVREGEADVLVKGQVNSSVFLKAVLDKEQGLRAGNLLSHLTILEVPGQRRLSYYTDAGMIPFPDYNQKVEIVKNAAAALRILGIDCPNVAALAANEQVSEHMPSSMDAARLAAFAKDGGFPGCVLEGPISFDVAVSREAAEHKGLESRVAGRTDLFLFPNIEAGNIACKALMYHAGALMAGVVLGAAAPVVLTSRASDAEEKLNSIVLACAMTGMELLPKS